jgi:quercetin dioxygenase-like cupin family protein
MAQLIETPTIIPSPGSPPKQIAEFVGRVRTGTPEVSIAEMHSPTGWAEPGQRPSFDEYTVVLDGALTVETEEGTLSVAAGQAVHIAPGEWVRYSTPTDGGAHYISVCIPGFSPDTVHRDEAP